MTEKELKPIEQSEINKKVDEMLDILNKKFVIDFLKEYTTIENDPAKGQLIKDLMCSEKLISIRELDKYSVLSKDGIIAYRSGYTKFLELKDKENRLKQDNISFKIRVNKWFVKTRWLSLGLSILSIIISILVAIYKK